MGNYVLFVVAPVDGLDVEPPESVNCICVVGQENDEEDCCEDEENMTSAD